MSPALFLISVHLVSATIAFLMIFLVQKSKGERFLPSEITVGFLFEVFQIIFFGPMAIMFILPDFCDHFWDKFKNKTLLKIPRKDLDKQE